ncbi:hypothetical protein ACFX13_038818 [Malus domestica]
MVKEEERNDVFKDSQVQEPCWAIGTSFVSFDALVQKINTEGIALQGSGWVRLALDKKLKDLVVETTANQMKGSACSHHAHFLKKPREKRR